MKILLINSTIYDIPLKDYGGAEQIVWDLMDILSSDHEVAVACSGGSSLPEGVEKIDTGPASISYSFEHEKRAWDIIKKRLKKGDIDIIHDHTHQKYIYLGSEGTKVISTLHNQVNFGEAAPVPFMNLVGLSKHHSIEASGKLGIPVKYVYNGIDLNRYEYCEDKGERYLFLGRISRFKGAHEAINIAKSARIPLDVVGEDVFVNDPSYVINVMDSCRNRVKYHGTVTHNKKKRLLSQAKGMIFPLLWNEPFGLTVIEAFASGTPVIATRFGAIPEMIEDGVNGFIVDHPSHITRELIEKLDDIDPKACLETAQKFDVQNMTNRYEELYSDVIEGKEW